MDLLAAWRVFVNVSERGSFTEGAAASQVPQPVASRRIAALEQHLGAKLFDRSARGALLTDFGRDLLPSAQRLVRLADDMEWEAGQALLKPLRLAVPEICAVRDLALLTVEAREAGVDLEVVGAGAGIRAELARSREVRAALVGTPEDGATWVVELGLAGVPGPPGPVVYVESLRPVRADRSGRRRRIWTQPEDDVPHIRDPLFRIRDAAGLLPAQVVLAPSLTTAAAEVMVSTDLLLCSPRQAAELGLDWRPIGEIRLVRGYAVAAAVGDDAERVRGWRRVAACLGVDA